MGPPPPPGEVLPWDVFRGGGGLPYGIIPPWGSSAMGFPPGEGLPSWGTLAIWYNFRGENMPWYWFPHHEICVWAGGREIYHRGGSFTIWYCFPPVGFLRGDGLPYYSLHKLLSIHSLFQIGRLSTFI